VLALFPGCAKTLAACKAFSNVANRRAEDYIPGDQALYDYP